MVKNTIYEQTVERLRKYNLFSETTIRTVAKLAKKQLTYAHYEDFFKETGISKPFLHVTKNGIGVPVLDIPAKMKHQSSTIVVYLPMGNPLDENQIYQVATIAAANPSYRVIAFGNPSGKPHYYRQQNLTFTQRFKIAFSTNKQALVEAELDYLQMHTIQNVFHVGYSFGALKALTASYYAETGSVKGIIVVEPVAHARYFKQLIENFQSTFEPMGEYVNRTDIPSYFEARKVTYERSSSAVRTLLRPINIAIAVALARVDFIPLFKNVLIKQPATLGVVAWGSESELGNDAHLKANIHNIAHETKRAYAMRLTGDKHAVANDIHLYAAIINEVVSRL